MDDENWKRSLEAFEIAYFEYAPGARRNLIELFPQVPDKQKAGRFSGINGKNGN